MADTALAPGIAAAPPPAAPLGARPVTLRSRGRAHGPITRLMSPGDLGEHLKPFVFLDLFDAPTFSGKGFAPHPHSGIATITVFLAGGMTYADSTGQSGALGAGAVEWMRAGAGVWHTGNPVPGQPSRGYQLWIALPPDLELAPAESLYLAAERVPASGPLRVILGTYQGLASPIPSPPDVTYLHIRLNDGESFTFEPSPEQDTAWLAVNAGRLHTAGVVLEREMAVFADGAAPMTLVAEGATELVLGAAARRPQPLVCGYYSVHSTEAALAEGERNIAALSRTPAVKALHGA